MVSARAKVASYMYPRQASLRARSGLARQLRVCDVDLAMTREIA